ncbi:nitrate ABC transporter permease [Advenella kashmirensis W13003]|uniref:Nitrate ABC transporter permease n=1 Tax=Advenella kashmirensis W13003 TaxID=1424334 RepID=V8QSL9_9BURK|nr:ABC transporter permease [Advenella kashmirensis]ETF02612.1 nitrate ABC transporter permease [Advenella kashmirensis W13003]
MNSSTQTLNPGPSTTRAIPHAANAGVTAAAVRRSRLGPGREIRYGGAIGPLLLLTIWTLGSWTGFIDHRTLSPPWVVVQTAAELIESGRLWSNFETSLFRALQGLFWGVLFGVVMGVIAGLSRIGEYIIDGPVQIKRAIPSLALIPLLMLWLGIGESMKITAIAMIVVVPIYIQTHDCLRSIDSRYLELSETLGVTRGQFIRHVVLPGALPGFLLGLRFAVTSSWLALVVVEQVNSTSGIGYMIELARTYGQTEIIVVGLALYALLGLTSDSLVRLLQKKVLKWRKTLND